MFPDYLTFELCDELVQKITNQVEGHKANAKEAVIYSLAEKTTMKSERRVSHKSSFQSLELRQLLHTFVSPLIYGRLGLGLGLDREVAYDVAIGEQSFDYIKYDTGGYFERHTDFVRISNPFHRQYTFLIGLSKGYHYSGNTVLWLPINSQNQDDYTSVEDGTAKDPIAKKYNFSSVKEMKALMDGPFLPFRINASSKGKALMFKSDLMHSGEEFQNWYAAKELLMFTINVTGMPGVPKGVSPLDRISEFDLPQEIPGLIPFQIIMANGEYNGKTFADIYLTFFTFLTGIPEQINTTLLDIYAKTKEKLNKRGRETHLASEILQSQSDLSERFHLLKTDKIPSPRAPDAEALIEINNYVKNYTACNKSLIVHTEKINNTWEESTCNDDGDEYDEITYLKCNIDIKFCYLNAAAN